MDPIDALEEVELRAWGPSFPPRWRAFLRACEAFLLPTLPPEAREWVAAADQYDRGDLDTEGLTTWRVRAWEFHNARRDSASDAELCALRAVMMRLWPASLDEHWYDGARFFVDCCETAGVASDRWLPLLRDQFPEVLGGSSAAS